MGNYSGLPILIVYRQIYNYIRDVGLPFFLEDPKRLWEKMENIICSK